MAMDRHSRASQLKRLQRPSLNLFFEGAADSFVDATTTGSGVSLGALAAGLLHSRARKKGCESGEPVKLASWLNCAD